MRVSFRRDPVSFVVALADQIQNYGRFSATFDPARYLKTVEWPSIDREEDGRAGGECPTPDGGQNRRLHSRVGRERV